MTPRFNSPPGWPTPPQEWLPPQNWQPEPSWPPAPPGWQFLVDDTPEPGDFDYLVTPNTGTLPRPWYKKKRYLLPMGCVVLLIVAGAVPNGTPAKPVQIADGSTATSTTPSTALPMGQGAPTASRQASSAGLGQDSGSKAAPAKVSSAQRPATTVAVPHRVAPKPQPKPKPKPRPRKTSSQKCDPNYSGGCVPIASDVDCAGGDGNGPAYFSGVAKVVGTDIYGLDRDGDGYACDSG